MELGARSDGKKTGSMPRVHQRSHRMRVVGLSMNVTVSPQCQRRQIKFWQLAFRRCVVSRRWRRALRNARRTGRRWTDVGMIYVNCVHSFWGGPLSWLDPDGPSAISLPMSAAVALGFILVALDFLLTTCHAARLATSVFRSSALRHVCRSRKGRREIKSIVACRRL